MGKQADVIMDLGDSGGQAGSVVAERLSQVLIYYLFVICGNHTAHHRTSVMGAGALISRYACLWLFQTTLLLL